MSDAATHPRILELPRNETRLATSKPAVRRLQELLPAFLDDQFADADADGFVVTLDGSVESTVAAAMAVEAAGRDRVTGLVAPARLSDEARARDAEAVAAALGVENHRMQLQPLLTAFQRVVGTAGQPADDVVAMANAIERFRMACAYYVANTRNLLVVGTVNRTDRLLGSVAKHGRNGVDISLLGDLYRTEVRALAADLNIPKELRERVGHRPSYVAANDAEALGVDPQTLDTLLRLVVDERRAPEAVADRLDVEVATVRRARNWCTNTRHKRHAPPKPSTSH